MSFINAHKYDKQAWSALFYSLFTILYYVKNLFLRFYIFAGNKKVTPLNEGKKTFNETLKHMYFNTVGYFGKTRQRKNYDFPYIAACGNLKGFKYTVHNLIYGRRIFM